MHSKVSLYKKYIGMTACNIHLIDLGTGQSSLKANYFYFPGLKDDFGEFLLEIVCRDTVFNPDFPTLSLFLG